MLLRMKRKSNVEIVYNVNLVKRTNEMTLSDQEIKIQFNTKNNSIKAKMQVCHFLNTF